MKIAASIRGWRRPDYLLEAVRALIEAQRPYPMSELWLSIDGGPESVATAKVAEELASAIAEAGLMDVKLIHHDVNLGVAAHPLILLDAMFDAGADVVLALEDDAVIEPDALELVRWFAEKASKRYSLMALCNHNEYGRGFNPGGIPDDPALIAEANYITAPFAFCMSSWTWPYFRSTWAFKNKHPTGWDFSLTMAMRHAAVRALHPIVSRCRNVGKFGGINETPDSFERTQTGIIYSSMLEPPKTEFKIVARLTPDAASTYDEWMNSEAFELREITTSDKLPKEARKLMVKKMREVL